MTRSIATLTLAVLVGCGGHAAPTTGSTSGGSTATPISDAHGTVVELPRVVPTLVAAPVWGFLPDGATASFEIVDASALVAAGARFGQTAVVSGDVTSNVGGHSAAVQALRLVSFQLDDVDATGRVEVSGAVTVFRDVDGAASEPTGPLASALLAGLGPQRVTGRRGPLSPAGNPTLEVTSFHATRTIGMRVAGGLTGMSETFDVDDLVRTGAARYAYSMRIFPGNDRSGRARITASERTDLDALVSAASLPTQPKTFRPTFPILDAPSTTISFADAAGDTSISIAAGATLPPELTALISKLRDLKVTVPTVRVLEGGSQSPVAVAMTRVARTDAEWQALYALHAPGTPAPTVDFSTQVAIGLFQGRQSSGGYSIAVQRLERIGDDLHVTVERRSPAPGQLVTLALTSPYQFVVVERKTATGAVFIDGVAQ